MAKGQNKLGRIDQDKTPSALYNELRMHALQLRLNTLEKRFFTTNNAIHWINCRSVGKCSQDKPCTPLDSDLSNGHRYPPFEQPRAEGRSGGGATRLEFRLHPRTS